MNDATAFRRASDEFVDRARHVGADHWSGPTPCTEWDVRQLVNHVAGEYLWVVELMDGKTIAEVGDRLGADVLGDDPFNVLSDAQRRACEAFEGSDGLTRTVHLSFGDVPAADYAQQMAVDSVIHSWDLARAIAGNESLNSDLVNYAYAYLAKNAEDWRTGGAFGPEKSPADDSLQAKLLAMTGR
jgi:uncharacterized protein (TIGR03086 family)